MPNFHDTRGHVLLALGRPGEALDALETALAGGMAGTEGLHRRLAEAYAALGRPELAAAHTRRADRAVAEKAGRGAGRGADRGAGRGADAGPRGVTG